MAACIASSSSGRPETCFSTRPHTLGLRRSVPDPTPRRLRQQETTDDLPIRCWQSRQPLGKSTFSPTGPLLKHQRIPVSTSSMSFCLLYLPIAYKTQKNPMMYLS
uniref:Uncharacterized protein n=1 Tax=Setaria viridis TaxID=4556 RepID=A0A4U6V996_SETVI|nr:hypothetical protein SEVIR_3G085100v2 [Setaria viridis]